MKIPWLLSCAIFICTSCKDSQGPNDIPPKEKRTSLEKEIVGVWELVKESYKPTEQPRLVTSTASKEYLEIKADKTYEDPEHSGKWFLSFTAKNNIDSNSNAIFTELTSLEKNGYGEYSRKLTPSFIKIAVENDMKYLFLTSLETSATRVYLRKK